MRIMLVTDQYPPMVGGVPRATRDLSADLANRGHQVWVVAPSYGTRDVRRLEQKVRVYRFSSFEWPAYEGQRIAFLPFMPIRNLIKKCDPDIIHVHSPLVLGHIAQMLAGGLRKPVIITNHYMPENASPGLQTDSIFGKQMSKITYNYLVHFYNRCEYVTSPTKTALDLLYQHGLHAPARVISNGIDLTKFTPGPRDPHVLRHLNLPEDQPIILHVNRLSPEKRIDVLLDAIPKMQHRAHVALVSNGPAEADLRAQAERLGISDRVSFLGFVRDGDLLALRRSSTLFTIPSEADLQSLATMEAMACGLPVVAANATALPELCHHEENGFLFQPGNSSELAQRLDEIVSDDELRARMGAESLKIIAKHDRPYVLDQWEEVYHRLSIEFIEAKERKQQFLLMRKYPGYIPPEIQRALRPRIRRTGDLNLDEPMRHGMRP